MDPISSCQVIMKVKAPLALFFPKLRRDKLEAITRERYFARQAELCKSSLNINGRTCRWEHGADRPYYYSYPYYCHPYSYSYVHNILIIRSCGWMDVSFCHPTSTATAASHHQTSVVWPLWQILILPVAPFRCNVTRYAVTITSVM